MILVSLGTQEFSFNRLLSEIDELIQKGLINEEVIAQIGYSTYLPRHYHAEKFIDFKKFDEYMDSCNILITHGGTGTIIGALKKGRRVIAVSRLQKYNEHVDDHQTEIIRHFSESNYIIGLNDVKELAASLERVHTFEPRPFESGNEKIMQLIESFIDNNFAAGMLR